MQGSAVNSKKKAHAKELARWRMWALVAFVVALTVNAIAASTKWLGGMTTGEVSDSYPNLFAPSGFTFSIWSVIYLSLIGLLLRAFGVWKTKKPQLTTLQLAQVMKLFTITSVINAVWMFTWQYHILTASVLLMIILLMLLLRIHKIVTDANMSVSENIAVQVPFSLYTGWITVATIANISTWLVSLGWNGGALPPATWTVITLGFGAAIGIVAAFRRVDWLYLVVFVWAYNGILHKHVASNGYANQYYEIVVTLGLLLPTLAACVLFIMARSLKANKFRKKSTKK